MSEPICPRCKREYPPGTLADRHRRHSESIKRALANSDMVIGRPRNRAYQDIWALRDGGMSIQKIADKLEVSRGSVQHALRKRTPNPESEE